MYLKSLCLGVIYSYYLYICRMSDVTLTRRYAWRVALTDHVWCVLQFKHLQLEFRDVPRYWYRLKFLVSVYGLKSNFRCLYRLKCLGIGIRKGTFQPILYTNT